MKLIVDKYNLENMRNRFVNIVYRNTVMTPFRSKKGIPLGFKSIGNDIVLAVDESMLSEIIETLPDVKYKTRDVNTFFLMKKHKFKIELDNYKGGKNNGNCNRQNTTDI